MEAGIVGAARADAGDGDAVAFDFEPERIGERDERGFGGAVDGGVRQAEEAGHRRDVDDVAGVLFLHDRQHGLHAMERAEEIHVEQRLRVGNLGLLERRAQADAGIVDEDVDAAKLGERLCDEIVYVFTAGDITAGRARGRDNLRACVGKRPRHRGAKAAAGAGDDHDFAGEAFVHVKVPVNLLF